MGFVLTVLGFFLLPLSAHAWGGVTHLEYAHEALAAIALFPPLVKKLLSNYREHFLYGSIAADITLGKNLRGYLYNCHNWNVAFDIYNKQAKSESQKAFMLGYMGHLAADTVAHNLFVPYKLIRSYRSKLLNHVYWEVRMDLSVPPVYWDMIEHFAGDQFTANDALLEDHLRTFFSFKTNKKIFNSLLALQKMRHYRKFAHKLGSNPDWRIEEEDILRYKALAAKAVINFLTHSENSYCLDADPTGRIKFLYARDTIGDLRAAAKRQDITIANEKEVLSPIRVALEKAIYKPIVLPQIEFPAASALAL